MTKDSSLTKVEGKSIIFYSDLSAEEICPDIGFVYMNSKDDRLEKLRKNLFGGYKPVGGGFNPQATSVQEAEIIIVYGSIGTGRDQDRAVEALSAGGIKTVIANGFERRFWSLCDHHDIDRIYLISLDDLENLCALTGDVIISIDMQSSIVRATNEHGSHEYEFSF